LGIRQAYSENWSFYFYDITLFYIFENRDGARYKINKEVDFVPGFFIYKHRGVFSMKNKLAAIWSALVVMAMIPACAPRQYNYNAESDFTVSPAGGGKGVVITGYAGGKFEVRIPPRIQNLPVTTILVKLPF
jgi:hypothetical protein